MRDLVDKLAEHDEPVTVFCAHDADTERILREAGIERQVAKAIAKIKMPSAAALVKGIEKLFKREPDREWRDHIEAIAKKAI